MKNGFIIAEKYLEDAHTWNTGKAKEIEKKYLKEDESIAELETFKKDLEKEIKNRFKGLMDVRSTDFEMTMEAAIYWFAHDFYKGQSDIWYAVLSNSEYNPGRMEKGVDKDGEEGLIYDYLKEKYGKKSLKESEEKHPYDLSKPTSKEADRKLLEFIKKYPNQWHSFSKDKATKDSIRKLEKQGTIEVNWKNEQFYFETKEQKDQYQSNYEVGIYPREDASDAEYAVYCKTTRTWSDFQGDTSKNSKKAAEESAKSLNKKIQKDEVKTPSPRVVVKVTYDNGDYTVTTINTDYEGAKKYYLGKVFTDEDEMTGKETRKKVVKVDLIKGPEQKDSETDKLFSRKDFFKFFEKSPEFKGKISVEGPREDSKGRVEFVITTPKGGKRIILTTAQTVEDLEKIGKKLLKSSLNEDVKEDSDTNDVEKILTKLKVKNITGWQEFLHGLKVDFTEQLMKEVLELIKAGARLGNIEKRLPGISYGVEYKKLEKKNGDSTRFAYLNTGDVYNYTLVRNPITGKIELTSYGEMVEYLEKKGYTAL